MLVVSPIFIFLVFYSFYHFHTYYILSIIPFVAIAVAIFLESLLKDNKILFCSVAALLLINSIFTFLLMSGQKYGYNEFFEIKQLTLSHPVSTVLTEQEIKDNFEPLIKYYLPEKKIIILNNEILKKAVMLLRLFMQIAYLAHLTQKLIAYML